MKWYVITTYSGYENKVKAALEAEIKRLGMESQFGEVLIPTETVQEVVRGAKRTTSRKFFPGYIFVQMELNERSWHLVKNIGKATGFIGDQKPSVVSDEEIRRLTQQIAEGAIKPKPRVSFEEGDNVRVIDGPFQNFMGTVDEVKPEKQKVRVLVSIFGRATPVELDYSQVEKTA